MSSLFGNPLSSSQAQDPLYDTMPSLGHNKQVWSVGGGKGGVGKSLVSANLSIGLALMGYKVIGLDLDLGGANLHTCLGIPIPEKTLSDFLTKKARHLKELLTPTPIKNLSIISGAQDQLSMANLKQAQKNRIMARIRELQTDFIIIDLGAGTSSNTLDFFSIFPTRNSHGPSRAHLH